MERTHTRGRETPSGPDALTGRLVGAESGLARDRGFALDDQVDEVGVNCLAVPVFSTAPTAPTATVSALTHRTPLPALIESLDEIRQALGPLGTGWVDRSTGESPI